MKVILLSGKARSGKDTAAEAILKEYQVITFAFADEVKSVAYKYFGRRGRKSVEDFILLEDQ